MQGDWIWIESLRGKIRSRAHISQEIRRGVLFIERFWNPETVFHESHGWKEMNVNVLTKADGPYNDVMGTYTLRGFLVKVYKAEQPPEDILEQPKQFVSWLPKCCGTTTPADV